MTREEAKVKALKLIDDYILNDGEDAISMMCPQPCKNAWTWKEEREAVLNDVPCENRGDNLIDSILFTEKWKEEHENKK
jgi:hypothetical protein